MTEANTNYQQPEGAPEQPAAPLTPAEIQAGKDQEQFLENSREHLAELGYDHQ